jgi:hypothetical protein
MAWKHETLKIFILLAGLASASAHATLITIEPDDFDAGTVLSNVSPYVTLAGFRKEDGPFGTLPTLDPVYAATCGPHCAATGTKVFGDGIGGIDTWGAYGGGILSATRCFSDLGQGSPDPVCRDHFNVLLMTFTRPTDFVEISGRFWAEDETYLYGFDDNFNFVGQMSLAVDFSICRGDTAVSDYCGVTTSLNSATGGIRYALAGGWSNGTSLDNLRFNSVPEPGTLALLGLGLVGVVAARRKVASSKR